MLLVISSWRFYSLELDSMTQSVCNNNLPKLLCVWEIRAPYFQSLLYILKLKLRRFGCFKWHTSGLILKSGFTAIKLTSSFSKPFSTNSSDGDLVWVDGGLNIINSGFEVGWNVLHHFMCLLQCMLFTWLMLETHGKWSVTNKLFPCVQIHFCYFHRLCLLLLQQSHLCGVV